jgi:hypothetical protein
VIFSHNSSSKSQAQAFGSGFIIFFFFFFNLQDTVKALNFGPHGNFELFLASSVASVDESCTKNE